MKKLLLATTMLFALASGANAVVVNAVTSVGDSGTTTLQGFADIGVGGQTVSVAGLTASLFLEFDGVTNNGLTWNFDYTIRNTSSGGTSANLTSFGFATNPIAVSGTSSGLFDTVTINPNFPNVMQAGQNIDICFAPDSGCQGGVGLANNQVTSGEFTLTFSTAFANLDLQQAFVRFQDLTATSQIYNVSGASGVGISNNLVITPAAVPGPAVGAGLPALITALFGLFGFHRMRRRRLTA